MIVKVTAVAAPGTEPGSLHWAQAVPSAALEMPVLIPAGPPALARGFGGQVRGLEVWQAPGGVRCDTGAFSTGSPQTPSCAPQRSPGWWVPLLLQLVCPQAAPQIAHTSYRHSPRVDAASHAPWGNTLAPSVSLRVPQFPCWPNRFSCSARRLRDSRTQMVIPGNRICTWPRAGSKVNELS